MLIYTGVVKLKQNANITHGKKSYRYVPYVGLYVFGIGAIVLDFLEFAASVQCTVIASNYLENHVLNDTMAAHLHQIFFENSVFATLNIFKAIAIVVQVCNHSFNYLVWDP